jgi:hypothetical protein
VDCAILGGNSTLRAKNGVCGKNHRSRIEGFSLPPAAREDRSRETPFAKMRKPDPLAFSRSATPPFAGHRLLKKSSPHVFKQFDPSTTLLLIPSLLL